MTKQPSLNVVFKNVKVVKRPNAINDTFSQQNEKRYKNVLRMDEWTINKLLKVENWHQISYY